MEGSLLLRLAADDDLFLLIRFESMDDGDEGGRVVVVADEAAFKLLELLLADAE